MLRPSLHLMFFIGGFWCDDGCPVLDLLHMLKKNQKIAYP